MQHDRLHLLKICARPGAMQYSYRSGIWILMLPKQSHSLQAQQLQESLVP